MAQAVPSCHESAFNFSNADTLLLSLLIIGKFRPSEFQANRFKPQYRAHTDNFCQEKPAHNTTKSVTPYYSSL